MKNKVFFNNSCNICKAEIDHYKKYANQNIEWVDITDNKEAQQITSKSYQSHTKVNPKRPQRDPQINQSYPKVIPR